MEAAALREAIARELEENLLPFWRKRCLDSGRGFIAEMAADGTVRADAPHGLILNSRLLWTFAALYRQLGDPQDLELARRAFDVLEGSFLDRDHGGYFWQIGADGRPLDRSKKTYGQAFCIYALSEFHLASEDLAPLEAARTLFDLIEHHAYDADHEGYFEARAEDWSETSDLQLSDKDMVAAKSMNTHLHLLEAYTSLFLAMIDPRVAMRLNQLISIFGRFIIRREAGGLQLDHFFDEAWARKSETRTYGHDIETAWLLCEAAAALGGEELREAIRLWSIGLARSTLVEGLDGDGALAYEGLDGKIANPDRDWWCQAEAVVGFWNAFEITGEQAYADAAQGVWRFIDDRVADRVNGEWFWRVLADGTIDEAQPKVSEWKGPYHSVRMCLEMMHRLEGGVTGENK